MTPEERAQILVTARLLRAVAPIGWLATGLTLVAASSLAFVTRGWLFAMAAVLFGLVAVLHAVRIRLDAGLFEDALAERLSREELDGALRALSMVPAAKAGRGWPARCRGARRLMVVLAFAALAQVTAVLLIAIASTSR